MNSYDEIIRKKQWKAPANGFEPSFIPDMLFDWQKAVVRWACKKGRCALFEDCGLGKTLQQIAWAENVVRHTGGNVLILAPIAVSAQTISEALKIGVRVNKADSLECMIGKSGIFITNYEKLQRLENVKWGGVVLDESSILKSHTGSFRNLIIQTFASVDYKIACTATPSPNDHTELGNHAEFLGVMTRTEMLASFFVHDGAETSVWRLKGHAQREFWRWVAGWAICMRTPYDIGFDGSGYVLPKLNIIKHSIKSGIVQEDTLFTVPARDLSEQRSARRRTMQMRVDKVSSIVASQEDQFLVWCEMNEEGDMLESAIASSVQVAGSDNDDQKESRMIGFSNGVYKHLITKPKIAGFGMNWQHCHNVAFVGLSHSYEQFYQAVRRCWRFGQKHDVNVHIIETDIESEIVCNIERKQKDADDMVQGMIEHMKDIMNQEIHGVCRMEDPHKTGYEKGDGWEIYLGDCVQNIAKVDDETIGFSIFSPPFASLYTYSNSPYDMGNCKDHAEFFDQFKFLTDELFRVTMPGRLCSFHCMNLPTSKERDGFIGIVDFRGILIRAFQDAGWIFHSEVCIWKDPVTAMQRTKALGLLHKTIRKDSCMSRQGIADYLVTMRKPGENPDRVTHGDDLPVSLWQQYASPVWMDINPSDTLQRESARDENDERHICPLQLQVIERALHLWSKAGDIVLSPFAGIGSEGYMATKMGRRFIGFELKPSYFAQAVRNLRDVEMSKKQQTIFDVIGTP